MKNRTIDLPLLPLNLTLQKGCSYRFLFIGNLLIMYRMPFFFFFFLKMKIMVKKIKISYLRPLRAHFTFLS